MVSYEKPSSSELSADNRDGRRGVTISSALSLAKKFEIDGRPIDDEERAGFLGYAGRVLLEGMSQTEQSEYVLRHFGVKLCTPTLGVQEGNLPTDTDDIITGEDGIVGCRVHPHIAEGDLRALHIMVGEEMLGSRVVRETAEKVAKGFES